MTYTAKSTELINWVENAIDRRKGASESSKINIAMQTLILLAGMLRSDCPMYPHEDHSFRIYWDWRRLLKRTEPDFYDNFYQLVSNKEPRNKGIYNVNGFEAIAINGIFKKITKAKARAFKSALKKLNKEKASFSSNYQCIENWCSTLGLSIDLIRLNDDDLNDLARYVKAMYPDDGTGDTDLQQQAPAA